MIEACKTPTADFAVAYNRTIIQKAACVFVSADALYIAVATCAFEPSQIFAVSTVCTLQKSLAAHSAQTRCWSGMAQVVEVTVTAPALIAAPLHCCFCYASCSAHCLAPPLLCPASAQPCLVPRLPLELGVLQGPHQLRLRPVTPAPADAPCLWSLAASMSLAAAVQLLQLTGLALLGLHPPAPAPRAAQCSPHAGGVPCRTEQQE